MTGVAQRRFGAGQKVRQLRGMGLMAQIALKLDDRRMKELEWLDEIPVTLFAQLGVVLADRHAKPHVVAIRALVFRKGFVEELLYGGR